MVKEEGAQDGLEMRLATQVAAPTGGYMEVYLLERVIADQVARQTDERKDGLRC